MALGINEFNVFCMKSLMAGQAEVFDCCNNPK